MHGLDLILTLTGGLTAALIFGYLTHRLGLSPIVGYLIAGTLVGPETPGFVANPDIADQLAEVGVPPARAALVEREDGDHRHGRDGHEPDDGEPRQPAVEGDRLPPVRDHRLDPDRVSSRRYG